MFLIFSVVKKNTDADKFTQKTDNFKGQPTINAWAHYTATSTISITKKKEVWGLTSDMIGLEELMNGSSFPGRKIWIGTPKDRKAHPHYKMEGTKHNLQQEEIQIS